MFNVFLFAGSFVVKTIIYKIGYLLDRSIDNVILLRENHELTDGYFKSCESRVVLCKDINECIRKSDFILIVNDEKVPVSSIEYIRCQSLELGKECYVVNSSREMHFSKTDEMNASFKSLPVVLNISLGVEAQSYCMELLLSKIFTDRKVTVKQFFSNETRELLEQLDEQGILSRNLAFQFHSVEENYNVIIVSINLGSDISFMREHILFFESIRPDFVILQTDVMFDRYDAARTLVKYNCFSRLEMIVKSHFRKLDNKFIVYCNKEICEDVMVNDINSVDIEDKVSSAVFAKLALPKEIVKI